MAEDPDQIRQAPEAVEDAKVSQEKELRRQINLDGYNKMGELVGEADTVVIILQKGGDSRVWYTPIQIPFITDLLEDIRDGIRGRVRRRDVVDIIKKDAAVPKVMVPSNTAKIIRPN